MMARLEIGEVSLTANISEILRQILVAVVTWNASLAYQFIEKNPAHFRELRCFAQGQHSLGVQRDGQFRA